MQLSLGGPSKGSNLIQAHGAGTVNSGVATSIANVNAQAKAWVSTVLAELANWNTGALREKWFGGTGDLSELDVRNRVSLTMNFIERELDGIHYVYPADRSIDSSCKKSGTIAYVWKYVTNDDGYDETWGPVCSERQDPFETHCALDPQGNYYVYLCERWGTLNENEQIATLVHEAAHHSGPGDITYNTNEMKQLPQSQQLNPHL